jgi:hypothetical protein
MRTYEIAESGGEALVREIESLTDLGSALKMIVSGYIDSSTVVGAQELEGVHSGDDIIDTLTFEDNQVNNQAIRTVRIKLKETAQNGQSATVRWQWNTVPFEVKVIYIGP